MTGPILYSVNPWFSVQIAKEYRNSNYFAWCSEYFDTASAPSGSASAAVAQSSNPREIYRRLKSEYVYEDTHGDLIKKYKRTFRNLATSWLSRGEITEAQRSEILSIVNTASWRIWRPVLYIIPREPIELAGRLHSVPHPQRAAYGPELQILDLKQNEFDIIELDVT